MAFIPAGLDPRSLPIAPGGALGAMLRETQRQRQIQQQQEIMQQKRQELAANLARAQAATQLAQAQTHKMGLPYGGQILPGPAGISQAMEMLRLHEGENSPTYQDARRAFDAMMSEKAGKGQYYKSNVALKYMQPLLKNQMVQGWQQYNSQLQKAGHKSISFDDYYQMRYPALNQSPTALHAIVGVKPAGQTGNIVPPVQATQQIQAGQSPIAKATPPAAIPNALPPMPPEDYDRLANQTAQNVNKLTTDPGLRQRIRFGAQAHQIFRRLNTQLPLIAKYSGPKGQILLAEDKKNALKGQTTPSYQAYQNYLANTDALASNLITFYKGSIMPVNVKRWLNNLRPVKFLSNPQQVLNSQAGVEDLFDREFKTDLRAANDAKFYHQQRQPLLQNLKQQTKKPTPQPTVVKQQPTTVTSFVKMKTPEGKTIEVLSSDVQKAIKQYKFRRI